MIAITVDIDWAAEEVIQDMLQFFEKEQVKCTLFCTHESEVIKSCSRDLFELAIHPNFNFLLNGENSKSIEQIIDELKSWYPEAKGIRSHSLTQNTFLLDFFQKKGFIYEANHFLPYRKNIQPFYLWNSLFRIPFVWEDDFHFMYDHSYNDLRIDIEGTGLKVFNFHPIHFFLNTSCEDDYVKAKKYYHDAAKLRQLRNSSRAGVSDALKNLISQIKRLEMESYKMIEVYNHYANEEDKPS